MRIQNLLKGFENINIDLLAAHNLCFFFKLDQLDAELKESRLETQVLLDIKENV